MILFYLKIPYDPEKIQILKDHGFRWDPDKKQWYGEPTPWNVKALEIEDYFNPVPKRIELFSDYLNNRKPLPDYLYGYQKEFVLWALERYVKKYKGLLLADDMGIGKTVQAIAFFSLLMKTYYKERRMQTATVYVTTKSVKQQYRDEVVRFEPEILAYEKITEVPKNVPFALVLHYEQIKTFFEHKTKNKLTEEEKILDSILKKFQEGEIPYFVVYDEISKKMKNKQTGNTKSLRKAFPNPILTLATTGTPMELNLKEFYTIVDIIWPGYFPYKVFERDHVVKKEIFNRHTRRRQEIISHYKNQKLFYERVKDIMLRRLKEDQKKNGTMQLGEKHMMFWEVPLDKTQETFINILIKQIEAQVEDKSQIPFKASPFLRQIFNHPAGMLMSDTEVIDMQDFPNIPEDYVPPKFKKIKEKTEELLSEGKQLIIFTYYTRTAKLLEKYLKTEIPSIGIKVLSGEVPQKRVTAAIKEFKDKAYNAIIATDTIAYGVNLQFVDHMIMVETPYNPAVFLQRTDRIYRSGSTTDKFIYVLYSKAEEKIIKRLIKRMEDATEAVEGRRKKANVAFVKELDMMLYDDLVGLKRNKRRLLK